MYKILNINQVKAIISKHLNKKIIDNLLKLGLSRKFYYNNVLCAKPDYHKFYYKNIILYAKTDTRYIFFCDFLNDIDICHYLYEYLFNKYFIINTYLRYNNNISISIDGKELDINTFEFLFKDLNPNIMHYINSIKLLHKL